jgi:integrase
MSIYKSAKSPYWQFDFEFRGHRFYGSTKRTTRREAEAVERAEREKAERHVTQAKAAATSLRLDDVAGRYWQEVGQHHAGSRNTERQLGYLIEFFGKDKLITDITDDDVAKLVAWRRGHRSRIGALISAYTVNDTAEQVRQLIGRCKLWGIQFAREPQWQRHKLTEPQERVRELVGDEGERLEAATRDDYAPFFVFARASGLRLKECCTLTWPEVDLGSRQIRKAGKGGKLVTVPITDTIREILWPLRGHHPEAVFTYVAQRTRDGRVQGERYPLTISGVQTAWRRLVKRAGVTGFRFHDHRHDLGTKILRDTGNLKLVQKARNHSSIRSTVRYAHVLDEDVAAALQRYQESRKKPRNLRDRKVS